MAGKVTAGLAESNGSLYCRVHDMHYEHAVGLVGDGGSPPPGS